MKKLTQKSKLVYHYGYDHTIVLQRQHGTQYKDDKLARGKARSGYGIFMYDGIVTASASEDNMDYLFLGTCGDDGIDDDTILARIEKALQQRAEHRASLKPRKPPKSA